MQMRLDSRSGLGKQLWSSSVSLILVCTAMAQKQPAPAAASLTKPEMEVSDSALLEQYDRALARVAEHAMRAVVKIEVNGYGPPEHAADEQIIERQHSLGSGIIVDPSGYIMTNNHVVAGAERIRVVLSPTIEEMNSSQSSVHRQQRTYPAKLIGTARVADLALIKIDASNLPIIPMPDFFSVRLGQ